MIYWEEKKPRVNIYTLAFTSCLQVVTHWEGSTAVFCVLSCMKLPESVGLTSKEMESPSFPWLNSVLTGRSDNPG